MITLRNLSLLSLLFILQVYPTQLHAQEKLSKQEIVFSIDSINSRLKRLYVFPKVASEMAEYLNANLEAGNYDLLTDPDDLAIQLTRDLQSISKDKHLRVFYDTEAIAEERNQISDSERALREKVRLEQMKSENYGFEQVKMLEGRIGYLDLRAFMETDYASKAAHKAMGRIINSDAIIIDLRNNGGGSPEMIQLLSSYFFGTEPVHLNSFYFRPTNNWTHTMTLPKSPTKRRPDVDLYILTSNRTFSAAEEFAYNLKHLNRATLIGETTRGGAHPGGPVSATDKLMVWMPQGRAVNPITQTNWEGVGVEPNMPATSDEALSIAHVTALERLKEKATDGALIHSYGLTLEELKRKFKLEQSKYADVLVDAHFESWNEELTTFYGSNRLYILDSILTPISPKAVLGNNYYYVALPKGSYLTLQFTDNYVVDVPGKDDLFIDEVGAAGDRAEVYVSSDGVNFEFMGVASGGRTNSIDLADIGFKGIVTHVKIVGLDLNGESPGFDVVRVFGLPHSNIDKYVKDVELKEYLDEPNLYERRILMQPIQFDFDSYVLKPAGKAYLDGLIKQLSSYPDMELKIIGHTDNIGTEEFNVELSRMRAKQVYDYFIAQGFSDQQLSYEGRGTREPLTHNDTEAGRKRNRRVELVKLRK